MVEIIPTIWAVAKELFGIRAQLKAAEKKRREEIADYFRAVSECLGAVYESLESGQIPHGRCGELAHYADQLPATIGKDIGQEKAEALANKLKAAHNVEGLVAQFSGDPKTRQELPKIAEASGMFAGLATSVRAGLQGQ